MYIAWEIPSMVQFTFLISSNGKWLYLHIRTISYVLFLVVVTQPRREQPELNQGFFTSLHSDVFIVYVGAKNPVVSAPYFFHCCISSHPWKKDLRYCGEKNNWYCGDFKWDPLKKCCKLNCWARSNRLSSSPVIARNSIHCSRISQEQPRAECSRCVSKCLQNDWV